jgi:hypothetical protein
MAALEAVADDRTFRHTLPCVYEKVQKRRFLVLTVCRIRKSSRISGQSGRDGSSRCPGKSCRELRSNCLGKLVICNSMTRRGPGPGDWIWSDEHDLSAPSVDRDQIKYMWPSMVTSTKFWSGLIIAINRRCAYLEQPEMNSRSRWDALGGNQSSNADDLQQTQPCT